MRKTVIVLLSVVMAGGIVAAAFSQDAAVAEEGWKRGFASPTYGVSIAPLTLSYNDGSEDQEDTVYVPGVEVRIFNGTNIAKRGGFYTGYEVGVAFYFLDSSDSYDISGTGYHISGLNCGIVFLMSKYGYRLDLGGRTGGFSIGPMIGIGLGMGGGSVDIVNESTDVSTGGDPDMIFGPMLEGALEGAFRFGQNFRVMVVLGANVSPLLEWDATISGEMIPVRPDLRIGFALNY